ncbi:MAG: S41 family peptidase [Candidatus Electryonea clarkiae]|nr:S41 family peptidase [Candidatus Electryonea clarkiae]MDP8285045.1 S41 family peptidase [Candidatus Electryonea clarkiae]
MNYFRTLLVIFLIAIFTFPVFAADADSARKNEALLTRKERSDLIKEIREYIFLFGTIYREINENYVDQVDPEEFLKAGIFGMMNTLDPYTEYFEPEDTDDLQIITKGRYGGIGIQIGLRGPDRELTIIAPIEGTPGWKLGLKPGDRIVEIDGESTKGFNTRDAANRMRGVPGTTVNVVIMRIGVDESISYEIERADIPVIDVSFSGFVEDGIGYIRLTRFSRNAGKQVRAAIDSLEDIGLESLIFDMRGNPGGLLPEAVNVAENFVNEGDLIVSTKGRVPTANREFFSNRAPSLAPGIPLIVLVSEGSASASEIVAGAIQDLDRGLIIGRTTFGKGLVQSVIPFNKYQTSLKLTTAKYYTPSGRLIQKIDYFTDNDALILDTTLQEESELHYFTTNGREVNAHGGIQPDFDVEQPDVSDAIIELWRQGMFYNFVAWYKGEYPELESWEITDEVYNSFRGYLDEQEFKFETNIEKNLAKILKDAEEYKYTDEFISTLNTLDSLAQGVHNTMLTGDEYEIRKRLKAELSSLIGGNVARVEATIEFDLQVQKALEVLSNNNVYAGTLLGTLEVEEKITSE